MSFKKFYIESKNEPKEYSEKELKERQDKKTNRIKILQKNIKNIKSKVSIDLNSDDERTKLIATIISIINITGERIGGENSANGIRKDIESGKMVDGQDPHYGVTTLKSSHVKVNNNNNNITLSYIGKSGVSQVKEIKDKKIISILKELKKKNNEYLFVTSNGLKIKANMVNDYLSEYNVSAKDLRGFLGNQQILNKLKSHKTPKEEKERKELFLKLADEVAEILGHSCNMLRNSYLLPDLEEKYIKNGNIISLG